MDKGDTTFMLVSTILVLLMILPGLALFLWRPGADQEHAVGAACNAR
jgi:ammonia channel protein AmtB